MKLVSLITLLALLISIAISGCYTLLREAEVPNETPEARAARERAKNEDKLAGSLRDILRLAEDPDTSEANTAKLERLLRWREDENGRIRVMINLWGMSGMNSVLPELESLDAKVDYDSRYSPFINCWLQPKDLRRIISMSSVQSIKFIFPAIHH